MKYRMLMVTVLIVFACKNETSTILEYITITSARESTIERLATVEYPYYGEGLFQPGEIDANENFVFLGNTGIDQVTGVSAYTWQGELVWSTNVDYVSPAICVSDSLLIMSLYGASSAGMPPTGELYLACARNGSFVEVVPIEGLSDKIYFSDNPDDYMPDVPVGQGISIGSNIILVNMPEGIIRFSYCGYITDWDFSFQRYVRTFFENDSWYIGMTEGHHEVLSKYLVPDFQYSLSPGIFDIALTDSSVIPILSRRDMLLEFAFSGELLRAFYFGHVLDGPLSFQYDKLASSTERYLISDVDVDEQGYIYLLYSGYAVGQDERAEIWRLDPVSLDVSVAKLDHSAAAFAIFDDKAAVVEQLSEPCGNNQIRLLGTPAIHFYRIIWDE